MTYKLLLEFALWIARVDPLIILWLSRPLVCWLTGTLIPSVVVFACMWSIRNLDRAKLVHSNINWLASIFTAGDVGEVAFGFSF